MIKTFNSNIFIKFKLSKYLFVVLFCFVSFSQCTQASCDNPISCDDEVSTFSPDAEPKPLEDFREGCYGIDQNDLTPILQKEDETKIGFFYLVKNPKYVEGSILSKYNIVVCASRKIDNPKFLSSDVQFPQTQESLDKNESYDDFLKKAISVNIKNSFNGNFSVKVTPNFTMLFKSKKVLFKAEEERFVLSNISFNLKNDISNTISTNSIIIALKSVDGIPLPTIKHLSMYEECKILPGDIVCGFSSKLRAPIDKKLSHQFLAKSNRVGESGKVIFTISGFSKSENLNAKAPPVDTLDSGCTDGNSPDYYLNFDSEKYILSQKEDVDMPSGVSCTVLVTATDVPSSSILAEREENIIINGVYLAENTENTTSSLSFKTTIESYTPSVATVAIPKKTPVSSGSSGSYGGGSHQDTIDKLRGGIGYRTIGDESDATATETILKCPEEKYIRYANQRGFGVSLALFKDTNPEHRAYNALIDLAEQHIVNGDNSNGYARLDSVVSRAEFVKIMTIAREDTLLLGDCLKLSNFDDVNFDDWFTPFVQNLEVKSIVRGYDGNIYKPAQAINLVEAYKVMALSFGYITLETAEKLAHDNNLEWYIPYVDILEKSGVIPYWLLNMDKDSAVTRGDIFMILSNILLQSDWMENIDW